MTPSSKAPVAGCSCTSDPFADLPPELRPSGGDEAEKRQRFGLRKVTCPGCGMVYTTNRATDLCMDCERKGVKIAPPVAEPKGKVNMLTVKVLGPGCSKCEFLEERTRQALDKIKAEYPDVEATIEKIGDIEVFMQYGLLTTPGLVINDRLVCAGRVASTNTIVDWMREALSDHS